MKRFFILAIFAALLQSLPASADTSTVAPKQQVATVNVINAPDQALPAAAAHPTVIAATKPTTIAVTKMPMPEPNVVTCTTIAASTEYQVGTDDILDVSVLQPEQLTNTLTVSPDGSITFPYIGTVSVRGKTLAQIQDTIQKRLSDGFMKYPVVSVSLKESHSRRFFVYGEVSKPGAYDIEDNLTVLRGISMAGGFTQFGSASRVKVLRPKIGEGGYDVIKVNITDVMEGVPNSDPAISQGDIIVVSEGIF